MSETEKYYLVIDQWLFQRSYQYYVNNNGEFEGDAKLCREIFQYILQYNHGVEVDEKYELVTDEYQKFSDWMFVRKWIKSMYANGNFIQRKKTEFEDEEFIDDDDRHYVEIALSSPNDAIISNDNPLREYINNNDELKVIVKDIDECLEMVGDEESG
jgi:predicted nucleic acid-binding protein